MIPIAAGARIWIATGHTDMRKGMQGLALLVQGKRRPRPIRKDLEGRIATRWRHGLQIR